MNQGDTYSNTLFLTDVNNNPRNLAGYTAQSTMKQWYTSNTSYSFVATVNVAGSVVLSMNAATTSTIPSGRYVYDVDLIDSSNNITRVVEGLIYVSPAVTAANIG